MDGRAFLASASRLLGAPSEENWRSAAGRAYYALLHEGHTTLERWGFPLPPRDSIHSFVRLRFAYAADSDLRAIGDALDQLNRLRNHADYRLTVAGPFASDTRAAQAHALAHAMIDLLDQIESAAVRRAAAIAALRAAFP